jgi:hypothetical protein
MIHERTEQAKEEKKTITNYLTEIDMTNTKIAKLKNPVANRRFRLEDPNVSAISGGKDLSKDKLKDLILRIRTTTINSSKFGHNMQQVLYLLQEEVDYLAQTQQHPN